MHVLVTGGAGYIGSHILCHLRDAGHEVVALDNLYSGHGWAVGDAELVRLDLADRPGLEALFASRHFDVVVHCAAHTGRRVVRQPAEYYRNNAANAFSLFDLCAMAGVRALIFSSTAAVYGVPEPPSRSPRMPRYAPSIPMARPS